MTMLLLMKKSNALLIYKWRTVVQRVHMPAHVLFVGPVTTQDDQQREGKQCKSCICRTEIERGDW